MQPTITISEGITMISIQNISTDMCMIADIFEKIALLEVDIDIISLSPVQSAKTTLTFTIKDDDLIKILEFLSTLDKSKIKPVVSSGNYNISILDNNMENNPGVASKIFKALATANTDIRVISTSEIQISIIVTSADYQKAYDAINDCIKNI